MKSEHSIAFHTDVPATAGAEIISATIARLRQENEALRRLAAALNSQLSLAREPASLEGQQQSH